MAATPLTPPVPGPPVGPGHSQVVQIAYAVDDVVEAAERHARDYGMGPFFVSRHIPLASVTHRGQVGSFDHSSAYGQWGSVMVELVCVHSATPVELATEVRRSPGLHHMAYFVDDLDAEEARLEALGHPQVMLAATGSGVRFAFHRAANLGHFFELYEPSPGLLGFYAMVRDAAAGWDGSDPVRIVS